MLIDLLHRQIRRTLLHLDFKDGLLEYGRFTVHSYERIVAGSPKTLVLIHGLGTSSSTWVRVLPRLDPAWNVLAIDLPGFGFSQIKSGPPFASLEELHQSVKTFITKKVSGPFVLLGHSLGGWLAARFAVEHPENVEHLILVDNAGILCEETLEQGRAFQVDSIADLRALLSKIWMRYPWLFRPFYPAVLKDLKKRHVAAFVQSIHVDDFLNGHLGNLAMKVSIIWGKQDRLISMNAVEILKQSIPHAEVHLVDRCGHVPQLEHPNKFAAILREILRQQA